MRHAENGSDVLMTATAKLNEAWVAVEADILPIVEVEIVMVPSQSTTAAPKVHGETELLRWLLDAQTDDQAGIALMDLPEPLRAENLLTACEGKGLIEFGRRNHCHVGGGEHRELCLERGYEFGSLNKPNRKSVRQLVRESIEDTGPKEIAIRVRLTYQGHADAVCGSLSTVIDPTRPGPIPQENEVIAAPLKRLFDCLDSAIRAGGQHLDAARRAPSPNRRHHEPKVAERDMQRIGRTGDNFLNKLKAIEQADLSVMPTSWARGLLYAVDHAQQYSIQNAWCFGRDLSALEQSLFALDGHRKGVEIELRLSATGKPAPQPTEPEPSMTLEQLAKVVSVIRGSPLASKTLRDHKVLGEPVSKSKGGPRNRNKWNYAAERPALELRYEVKLPPLGEAWTIVVKSPVVSSSEG